jgi:hypothetical protein
MIANRLRFSLSRDQREPCNRKSTATVAVIFALSHGSSSWLSGNCILRAALPDYRAVEASVNFTSPLRPANTIHKPNVPREAAQKHFRQGLSSNLHFRQFNGSKTRIADKWRCQIARFCLHLRQVIASNRGNELIQVTIVVI